MLKQFKKILIITCCLLIIGGTVFAETPSNEEKGFTIHGYTFTYENAPQEIKDEYNKTCSELGIQPQPNAEIFIPYNDNDMQTYNNIDMYSARASSFRVTYHYSYYEVTGDMQYTVATSKVVGYGNITSGNPVHLVQLLLTKANYSVSPDSLFGSNTYNKVKSFQSNNGLSADGLVGGATWKKFASVLNLD